MGTAHHALRQFTIAAFWLAAWSLPPATHGFADSFENDGQVCNTGNTSHDDTIAACTRRIDSNRLKGDDLALTFYNRANEWKAKGELDKAIADYNEALRIAPIYSAALNNRGLTWYAKGDADRAMA